MNKTAAKRWFAAVLCQKILLRNLARSKIAALCMVSGFAAAGPVCFGMDILKMSLLWQQNFMIHKKSELILMKSVRFFHPSKICFFDDMRCLENLSENAAIGTGVLLSYGMRSFLQLLPIIQLWQLCFKICSCLLRRPLFI